MSWSPRSCRSLTATVVAVSVLVAACGSGSADDNLDLVDRFPEIDGVVTVSTESNGYCNGDTCLFGDDGVGTLVVFDVTAPITDGEIVDAFAAEFEGWRLTRSRECLSANDDDCAEEVLLATMRTDEALLDFNFDNWPTRFEVFVDAHAG